MTGTREIAMNFAIEFFKMFVPIVGTFFITKLSLFGPIKMEIRKQQFDEVYYPLYKLTRLDINYNQANRSEIQNKLITINTVINNNPVLCYQSTLELIGEVNELSFESTQFRSKYRSFCQDVEFCYNKVKNVLGYPRRSYKESAMDLAVFIWMYSIFFVMVLLAWFDGFNGRNLLILFIAWVTCLPVIIWIFRRYK